MRRPWFALGAAALLALPAQGVANDGPLYLYGASPAWAVRSPFVASSPEPGTFQLSAPAAAVGAGRVWEMNWGCPLPGTEFAAVRFGALRTAAASSLQVEVLGNGNLLWAEPDSAMPQSPAGGRQYDVGLPPGLCNIHLALDQTETRQQHARTYFVADPRVLVRDVSPPSVSITGLSQGWLGAGPLHVAWNANDNYGDDGMTGQRVAVAGVVRWSGAPGAGDHAVDLELGSLPDGPQPVTVTVDGDGTRAGTASGTAWIDRTPPTARALHAATPGTPGAITLGWTAADATSGVVSARAEVNAAPDGSGSGEWIPVGAAAAAGTASVIVAPPVPDGVHAWRVRTVDAAGNVALSPGPGPVVVDRTAPAVELHSVPATWIGALNLDLTATDALAPALGLGATEIDVNAAPDGSADGEWLRRSTSTGPAGRRIVACPCAACHPAAI